MTLNKIPFDSVLWEQYRGAYGNIKEDIQLLTETKKRLKQVSLRRLENPDNKSDWRIALENLSESLYHQMSFYPALYLALPYLVALLEERNFDEQFLIYMEIGCCLSTDIPPNRPDIDFESEILESYQAAVILFQEKLKAFLSKYLNFMMEDKNKYRVLEFLTAAVAILGEKELTYVLLLSAWDNVNSYCTDCGFTDEESGWQERVQSGQIIPAAITGEWDGQSFTNIYQWLVYVLQKMGMKKECQIISCLYGTYTCPECGTQGLLLTAAKNYLLGD